MKAQTKRQLNAVDWDFITDPETEASGLHWYPGTFVPALPGTLIEGLSDPNSIVVDPYGGVGTTAIAALLRGRRSISVDSNPIATLATFSGVALIALRVLEPTLFFSAIQEVSGVCASLESQRLLSLNSQERLRKLDRFVRSTVDFKGSGLVRFTGAKPARHSLEPWYGKTTLRHIIQLRNGFVRHPSALVAAVGLTMVSSIARQLCSQNKSWGHIADNVLPEQRVEKDVYKAGMDWLQRSVNRIERSLKQQLSAVPTSKPLCYVREYDWLLGSELELPERPSLLVTSPPYAGAIDYTLAQRLSLYILGAGEAELMKLCSNESGARRKRFNKQHIATWSHELGLAVERQLSLMTVPAFAAFVMPHKDHGRDLGEIELKTLMSKNGWSLEFEKHRSIRQVRARQSWTSIKRETILVFEKT